MSAAAAVTPVAAVQSRRERLRAETTAEIKDRAWTLMGDGGVEALSLREVARQMAMAPSALYRYFPSRNDLLTALIVDGFDSLGATLDDAYAKAAGEKSAVQKCLVVGRAHRGWAIDHPTRYALIYSTSIPDYYGTPETTAASERTSRALMRIVDDLLAEGLIDLDRIGGEINDEFAAQLAGWHSGGAEGKPAAALAAALRWYAVLHGLIHLEMNGHYPPSLQDSAALFDATLRAATLALGPQ